MRSRCRLPLAAVLCLSFGVVGRGTAQSPVPDSAGYAALWNAADAAIDAAQQLDGVPARRDSLYLLARRYAEAAIRADSLGPEGHFELAQALGRYARARGRGARERVRYGRIIYDEAVRALALDPRHDGAHHVLGAWHAEVKRLSAITRFLAQALLGPDFVGRANWDSATAHLERAVQLRPDFIYHRLELAHVYLDRHREDAARTQLERIAALPVTDVMDPTYQKEAADLLAALDRRGPRTRKPPDRGPAAAAGAGGAPGPAALIP